jgi:cytochrome c oxidase cbb3-type subunit 4
VEIDGAYRRGRGSGLRHAGRRRMRPTAIRPAPVRSEGTASGHVRIYGNRSMELAIYHWILIAAFVAIVIWAFGRKRKARFDKDARMPFDERND